MKMKDFAGLLASKRDELGRLIRDILPVKVGAMAKRHFQDSFINGGFTDRSLAPWPKSRRLSDGAGSARDQNHTLLSSRKHLYGSISYVTRPASVRVFTDMKYAAIHNEGGTIPITPRMRRYMWARYYEAAGAESRRKGPQKNKAGQPGNGNPQAEIWKRMALTKKTAITMPKRQFMGDSAVLRSNIEKKIESEIFKVLNNG